MNGQKSLNVRYFDIIMTRIFHLFRRLSWIDSTEMGQLDEFAFGQKRGRSKKVYNWSKHSRSNASPNWELKLLLD